MSEPASPAQPTVPGDAPSRFEIVASAPGRLTARGELTFSSARRARIEGLRVLRASNAQALEIDCAAIERSDSAGLAVLLDWLAVMKREGRPLRIEGLPSDLLTLARISGVEDILQRGV